MTGHVKLMLRLRPGQPPGLAGPYRSTKERDRDIAEYLIGHPECDAAACNVSDAGRIKVWLLSPQHKREIVREYQAKQQGRREPEG